jgi:hypothetical protein
MEALAVSPKGVEAATRLRLKRATAQALMRMTRNKAFPSDKARRDFCWQTPIAKTGWLVDLSEGQPAHDAQGRLVYAYRTAGGGKREVPVPAAALGYGPAAESAAAQGGELLAKDYLDAEGVR